MDHEITVTLKLTEMQKAQLVIAAALEVRTIEEFIHLAAGLHCATMLNNIGAWKLWNDE